MYMYNENNNTKNLPKEEIFFYFFEGLVFSVLKKKTNSESQKIKACSLKLLAFAIIFSN